MIAGRLQYSSKFLVGLELLREVLLYSVDIILRALNIVGGEGRPFGRCLAHGGCSQATDGGGAYRALLMHVLGTTIAPIQW